MKPRAPRFMSGLIVVVICLSALAACGGSDRSGGTDAVHTVMTWCRVAEFPANRTGEKIETKGSAATREFDVTFQASAAELTQWIAASPGLKEAASAPVSGPNGEQMTLYTIKPKDAAYCVVRINHAAGVVEIKAYWS